MSRQVGIAVAGVIVIAAVVGGAVFWFLPGNPELSADVNEDVERIADAPEIEAAVTTTPEPETETSVGEGEDEQEAGESIVFRIDSERSQVEFNIDEVLRGEDFTVVGVTNQVAGDIRVDFSNPTASEIGEILINARALETDASGRDRAMRNFILLSAQDENEFISFEPTALENLPETVSVSDEITFQVIGDLTIIDTTQEVTFDVTLTVNSEKEIEGIGETTVLYQDFNITIPSVPFVASVEDDVILKIDFVAIAVDDNV